MSNKSQDTRIGRAALKLYLKLTEDFPAPWRVTYHPPYPDCVAEIIADNGETPLTLETHSGDGDGFYLQTAGAEALVDFVNEVRMKTEVQ